jgi:signal transduction histidine kinase
VDDNPAKILALETALAPLGQNLVAATSGREALRQLLERSFATVILDVNMPGMDGFETAQMIRGRPRSAHTPIIFVSSINLADTDAARGYALGAVDYILAPIVPEILRAKVAVFVELHRQKAEARQKAEELERKTRELEESQHQLRLAERMAALGTLSAGLGHDMGNLLLPIQARLESLQSEPLEPHILETLKGVQTCVGYLRRLASGLRMLSMDPGADMGQDQITDLGQWWPDAEPMLRNVLPASVELTRDMPADVPPVRLPRHLVTQVVFNLVQNAADAMRAQATGTVIVSAHGVGEGVRIAVTDNGPGMSPDVRRRCLEPFFTTKTRALSTGLGLALVHAIVQKAGGTLQIDTDPGQGACFALTFPAAPGGRSETRPLAVVTVTDPRKRSLIVTLLEARGMRVDQGSLDDAAVWVTDSGAGTNGKLAGFINAEPSRRVVVLGSASEMQDLPGVVAVDDSEPGAIRRALAQLRV